MQPTGGALGSEMSFARDRMLSGHRVAIIKWYVEGSDAQWWVTNNKISTAIAYFDAQLAIFGTGTVKGIVWNQGESEDATTVLAYQANLGSIIGALWTHYGDLPVVMVGQPATVSGQTAQVTSDVQTARAAWVTSVSGTRRVTVVTTNDLPYENDPHWDAPSINTIGRREVSAFAAYGL